MSKKKLGKAEKEKAREPVFSFAEGELESVGVQNGVNYIVIGGKKISGGSGKILKVEVKK